MALREDDAGKKQFAVALSAKLSGSSVAVRVDDNVKNPNGQCYLKYLES